ncbi:MAG: 3-oxoacyl-[acyl-carrier-protein] synthase [Verrucomicrobiota bacterium]|jgi:3-oxoacyl-[acyl-carrier-protein] synthase-1
MLRRAVVTGLGLITSIGNSRGDVLDSLRNQRRGIEIHPELDLPEIPVKLAGTIKGFHFPTENRETWKFPEGISIPRTVLRGMSPHAVFAYAAMQEAIVDAALNEKQISDPGTGMMCASAGSTRMLYRNVDKMLKEGILRCHPLSVAASIAGTLNFNLVSAFKIRGPATGFVSACSSSAVAFGHALDLIRQDRQQVVFVAGAEDCDLFSILPFGSCRALTTGTDPTRYPCAFDVKRDGFAATGGAAALVLEELSHAQRRGAKIYAEALGWGQTSDGYDVMAPEPSGQGLQRAMQDALRDAGVDVSEIDYINAHATSTPSGDAAECRALKKVFGDKRSPLISSTKSQIGHALSMAGALEAAICSLSIRERFTPVSMNITELDPECEGLRIVTESVEHAPRTVLSNSSAFGGANVSLVLREFEQ